MDGLLFTPLVLCMDMKGVEALSATAAAAAGVYCDPDAVGGVPGRDKLPASAAVAAVCMCCMYCAPWPVGGVSGREQPCSLPAAAAADDDAADAATGGNTA